MKRAELHIQHLYKNRMVGHHRLEGRTSPFTVGSSRDAALRLMGEQVGGIHASIERQGSQWVLLDLGSEHGTWVDRQPIVQKQIDGETVVQIGQHQLKLTPVEIEVGLFDGENSQPVEGTGETFHQIVVKKAGLLYENSLIPLGETYSISLDGQLYNLKTPTSPHWVVTRVGDVEIHQRLVRPQTLTAATVEFFDSSLRGPLVLAALAIFILVGLVVFMPKEPKDAMVALKPEDQNTYTRMIYDANKVKKQRAEAQKLTKQMAAKTPETSAPKSGGQMKEGGGSHVVNNIKASGLQALIGKISARAAKNVAMIESSGVRPDTAGSGMALGVGRSVASTAPNAVGLGAGQGHKLGGVGTEGKGGGTGNYKGFGGLALGNIGQATVGVLEEETEVDGGLDKEVIARYIKSQLGQIRYCYERQLSASPDLYGKVMVKFTIGATGSVTAQSVANSSMNNSMVEGCILRRVASWQFPIPKGGTQVLVSYPFLFKSTK